MEYKFNMLHVGVHCGYTARMMDEENIDHQRIIIDQWMVALYYILNIIE